MLLRTAQGIQFSTVVRMQICAKRPKSGSARSCAELDPLRSFPAATMRAFGGSGQRLFTKRSSTILKMTDWVCLVALVSSSKNRMCSSPSSQSRSSFTSQTG